MSQQDEGPLSRAKHKMDREMQEKSPMEAIKDDLFGESSGEPSEEEQTELHKRVAAERQQTPDE